MSRLGSALVYGIATIFVLAALVSFVVSLLLKWTDIHESSLTWLVFAASMISMFLGGVVAGGKSQEKGWLAGGLTSVGFTSIIFLFQFLGIEKPFTAEQWLYHLAFLAASALGGIVGVNLSPSRRERA
ncbi:TIGR04086 family membrane protein [Geobacillus sp. C56-T2]|uniref:TIGR04086 family membrane protein n=1 Tax=Geobacillus sp. C56-T2 TaxID=600773 RepID=UPI0011A2228D|nr:TIGR04086 family membrane protein [Geobacillus sp. C56-T2]NNV05596.1 TIGR04086 family membrane protein [Geobacillus sp. MMMUD3]TWG31348.1 putative membrane protein (TIGR04086 family) [Geobacillus sp. C56-T2]